MYKPTTPGRRKTTVIAYSEVLTATKPNKKLIQSGKNQAGRGKNGKISIRHRGGGYKKQSRIMSFAHNFVEGFKVITVEYAPDRSAFVSQVVDMKTGVKHYVLYTKGFEVGKIYNANKEIITGNRVNLSAIPVGTEISQVELNPGQGAKMARGAGAYATVTARETDYVSIKLPSNEIRKILGICTAVIGRVGNEAYSQVRIGKAGRNRHKGIRPTVRGKVMNPADHPHGGGEARNSIGLKYPKTPWGKHALGVKTRSPKKPSSKYTNTRRKNKNEG